MSDTSSELGPRLDLTSTGYDQEAVAAEFWQIVLETDMCAEGEFKFNSGVEATLKVDASVLERYPKQRARVLEMFAAHPCMTDADLLIDVPDGMFSFARSLSKLMGVPLLHPMKEFPGQIASPIIYRNLGDREIAFAAKNPKIIEDIVTSLGSVARTRLLLPADIDVDMLAMLRRGPVSEIFRTLNGPIIEHYLLEREIPLDADEFKSKLETEWV